MLKVCLAGEGAQGATYMESIQQIAGIEVVSLVGGIKSDTREFAAKSGIPRYGLDFSEALAGDIDAVILDTPSQLHRQQAEQVIRAGKHLLLEIPMALTLADFEFLADLADEAGVVALVAHTRRFSPVYLKLKRRIDSGELQPLHIVTQTYFFRRQNLNRFGQPRTWVDSLLWHHACDFIDSICWLLQDPQMEVWAQAGPDHPELGIPMDITIGMRSSSGVLVSSICSFNHHGPIQVSFKTIGVQDTLRVDGPLLLDHQNNELLRQHALDPFINICRHFEQVIVADEAPRSCLRQGLSAMRLIDRLQGEIDQRSSGANT